LRTAERRRETRETQISVKINLDGCGKNRVETPIAFLNHMLTSIATHSFIDLEVEAKGDLQHHITEDTAITLGEALTAALGDMRGITRFGSARVPMDESLAEAALDVSGRPYSVIELGLSREKIEDMACEDISHFLRSLATSSRMTIHIKVQYGDNNHHRVEVAFKALALSLRQACKLDESCLEIPSSKGVI
jgi:imidazoleglycerol-phosphate dehydratase